LNDVMGLAAEANYADEPVGSVADGQRQAIVV
jgi:hypothetical protein